MKTPRHIIAASLAQRSLGKVSEADFAKEIAAYLLAEHRVNELDSIIRDIMLYRSQHGITEVIASSAHPLNDAITKQIESEVRKVYPTTKTVIVNYRPDETVVGGVRLEFADQQLDLTVRNTLNRFKQLTV